MLSYGIHNSDDTLSPSAIGVGDGAGLRILQMTP